MRIGLLLAALVMLAMAGCGKAQEAFDQAKHDIAHAQAKKLAHEGYARWALDHPDQSCPAIGDLLAYADAKSAADPWGRDFVVLCGDRAPPAARGIGVVSIGPDGRADSPDDIKSWE